MLNNSHCMGVGLLCCRLVGGRVSPTPYLEDPMILQVGLFQTPKAYSKKAGTPG